MKKICAVFAVFMILSCSAAAQQIKKEDFKAFSEIKTIESGFTMKKYVSIASEPLVSEGKFYFQRPDMLRWEYFSPFSSGFVINKNKAWSWQEKDGKKEVKDISGEPAAAMMAQQLYTFISMDMDAVSKYYRIEKTAGGINLFPKNDSKKQMIERINIMFSKTTVSVSEVQIIEKSGDKTVITFTDTKTDGAIPENAFVF